MTPIELAEHLALSVNTLPHIIIMFVFSPLAFLLALVVTGWRA